jgi:hypothetical protein
MTLPEGHYEDLTNEEPNEWAPYESEEDAREAFEDLWDQCYPEVTMGQLSWQASRVLRELDPIAYRQELLNYVDSQDRD